MVGVFVLQDTARLVAVTGVPGRQRHPPAGASPVEARDVAIDLGINLLEIRLFGHQIDVETRHGRLAVHVHHAGQQPVISLQIRGGLAQLRFVDRAMDHEMLRRRLQPAISRQGRLGDGYEQADQQRAQDELHGLVSPIRSGDSLGHRLPRKPRT